jgi:hypothetical protein
LRHTKISMKTTKGYLGTNLRKTKVDALDAIPVCDTVSTPPRPMSPRAFVDVVKASNARITSFFHERWVW